MRKVMPNFVALSIVFVHGLTGNRESTWTWADNLWPQTLLPEKIPGARIMTFGYDADVVNFWQSAGQNRIGHHAQDLAQSLANKRDMTETASCTDGIVEFTLTESSQRAPFCLLHTLLVA